MPINSGLGDAEIESKRSQRSLSVKAVVRRGRSLISDETQIPTPGPGQLLVRTLACGICGSDLHALDHLDHMVDLARRAGGSDALDANQDVIFGHEFCGEVMEGSASVTSLRTGARVVSMPYAAGPKGLELIGYSNRFPGGFGEYMVLQAASLLEVPNGLPSELAAMVEPMAVGEHAVGLAAMTSRSVAMVIGCGPVGLSIIAALHQRGVGPIVASDYSAARRAMAERLGAHIIIDPAEHSPHGCWEDYDVPATLSSAGAARMTGRDVRDAVIFECVGVPGMLQNLIEFSPPGAQIIVVGACMEADRIEPLLALNKQLSFRFAFGYSPDEFRATLHAIAEGTLDVRPMVSTTIGLGEVTEYFERLRQADDLVKVVIRHG